MLLEKAKTWVASLPVLDLEKGRGKKKIRSFEYSLNPKDATEKYLIPNSLGFVFTDQENIYLKSVLTG